jgi:predicted transcriptional regulator of viral defense system
MPDSRAQAVARHHQIEDVDDTAEEVKDAARRVVASRAVGATHLERVADTELIMTMLGIHPSQNQIVA